MAEDLRILAACLRMAEARKGSEAKSGVTLMQALAHLDEPAWRRWVERDVQIPVARARELIAAAEQARASVDALRPPELSAP
jgi:hypothetical protein